MTTTLLTIFLGILLVFIALGVGGKILRLLKIDGLSESEGLIFCVPLGLGITAIGIFFLGILGLFQPIYIAVWLFILLLISITEIEIKNILERVLEFWNKVTSYWQKSTIILRFFTVISIFISLLILVQALTPPWDYDGLMYHLEGSRRFLSAGRIAVDADIYQVNGPFLIEMLFASGIGFGIDSLAKIIHYFFGVIVIFATFIFGNRYLGDNKGWIPAIILISTSSILIFSSFAYVDVAWTCYQFLAIFAMFIWMDTKQSSWLLVSGIFMGFSLGTKYMALGYAVILSLTIVWIGRKRGIKTTLKSIGYFGGTAILVGIPWYLKNLIWTGNPVYPLFFGGEGWPIERVQMASNYLGSFGTGKRVLDYLLLPWNLYFNQIKFTTMGSIEKLNPLFVLVPGYPFVKKLKPLNILAAITLLGFIMWAISSQQIRFLLPLFPILSILSGYVLIRIGSHVPGYRLQRVLIPGILGGFLAAALITAISFYTLIKPLPVILGMETKANFLDRLDGNYSALEYIDNQRNPEEKVFMIWDGRSYYCDGYCLPDTDNYQWTYLVENYHDIPSINRFFQQNQIAYILLNTRNANFMLNHDPVGEHLEAVEYLSNNFLPACGTQIYYQDEIAVYKINCGSTAG